MCIRDSLDPGNRGKNPASDRYLHSSGSHSIVNTILQDIIEHHIWANDTLLAFCEKLTPDQLALTVPGTFGTVEETLVHVAANEEAYLHGLAELGVGDEMRATIFDGDVPRRRRRSSHASRPRHPAPRARADRLPRSPRRGRASPRPCQTCPAQSKQAGPG